jgi:Na+/proline symporter
MSSTLNSLGATLFEDFVRPCLNIKVSDKTSNNIIKLLVTIIGAVCVIMVFFVDKIGGIVQVGIQKWPISTSTH